MRHVFIVIQIIDIIIETHIPNFNDDINIYTTLLNLYEVIFIYLEKNFTLNLKLICAMFESCIYDALENIQGVHH